MYVGVVFKHIIQHFFRKSARAYSEVCDRNVILSATVIPQGIGAEETRIKQRGTRYVCVEGDVHHNKHERIAHTQGMLKYAVPIFDTNPFM